MTKVHQQHTQTSKQEKQQTVLLLFLFELNTLLSLRNTTLITCCFKGIPVINFLEQ